MSPTSLRSSEHATPNLRRNTRSRLRVWSRSRELHHPAEVVDAVAATPWSRGRLARFTGPTKTVWRLPPQGWTSPYRVLRLSSLALSSQLRDPHRVRRLNRRSNGVARVPRETSPNGVIVDPMVGGQRRCAISRLSTSARQRPNRWPRPNGTCCCLPVTILER